MNENYSTISLFFGGLGSLFVIFAALEIGCNCMIPSLIFVLFHTIMVLAAFPFFVYILFRDPEISNNYLTTVLILSTFNSLAMFVVSYLDPQLSNIFYVAAALELLPVPLLLSRWLQIYPKFHPTNA